MRKPLLHWTQEEFCKEIESQFAFSEATGRVIFNALAHKQHVLFHGPAGHAKTEIVRYALEMIQEPADFYKDTFITDCGPRMDVAQFQGYQSLPAFKEGRKEVVMEGSMFVSYKYALLDEMLTAPEGLLLFIRGAITAGEICVNGTCYKSSIQSIFACTNVNPAEWAEGDASKQALIQRFMFRKEVKWNTYTAADFDAMFLTATGVSEPVWAEICEETHKKCPDFSPRSAMVGLNIYRSPQGLAGMENFDGISQEIYDMWVKVEKDKGYINMAYKIGAEAMDLEKMLTTATPRECRVINFRANKLQQDFGKLKIPPGARLYEPVGNTKKRLQSIVVLSYEKGQEEEPEPVVQNKW